MTKFLKKIYFGVDNLQVAHFFSKSKARQFEKIIQAARAHHRLLITYLKKNGYKVSREIRPYSYKDGYLYATDNKDSKNHIKSYRLKCIKTVKIMKETFTPMWKVEL